MNGVGARKDSAALYPDFRAERGVNEASGAVRARLADTDGLIFVSSDYDARIARKV